MKNFTIRMTHGSWFSASSSCGRIRTLGVYEVVSCPAVEEGLAVDEFGQKIASDPLHEPFYSALQTSLPAFHPIGLGILHPADGDIYQAACNPGTSSIPTALVGHEWGQKGISLIGKEFTRHLVYRLTEKEVELCKVQMQDLVRRRVAFEAMSYGDVRSSVSRRSSSASSVTSWRSQAYGFGQWKFGQLTPSGSSFGSMGYRLEQISPSGVGQGRRNRHRHSSSMPIVPHTSGAFGYKNQFGTIGYKPCTVTWADQYARTSRRAMKDSDGRDLDDYILV